MTTKTRNITFMPGGLLAMAVCGLLVVLTAPPARAQLCESPNWGQCELSLPSGPDCNGFKGIAGDPDEFCPPTDPATGSALPALCANSVDFDDPNTNRVFCETFTVKNPADGAAHLEIRLKALGGEDFNDSINLYNAGGTFLWGCRIGFDPLLPGSGLVGNGVPWASGSPRTFCLNLSALPLNPGCSPGSQANILSKISGTLRILVQDDTSVDYAILSQSQCPKVAPAVAVWGLGALGLVLLSGVALKFGRRRAVQL